MDAICIRDLKRDLKKNMDESRYEHTLGVMYTAGALAMRYECDLDKALLAGLMHDCAKCMPNAKKLKVAEKHGLEITEIEQKNPFMLHAKVGALLAEKKYDIEDQEVLSAIRWHTTGKPGMNTLEKIIFIADYIEPNRKMLPGMEQIRKASFEDLDLAMYLILKNTIAYLKETQDEDKIDTNSMQAYEYYKAVIKAR